MMSTQRLHSLDFFRGVSVLFLIPLHCMMMYASAETWNDSNLGFIMKWIERGSPSFMVAMGISFVFSKRQSFKALLIRGFKIVGIGYLLNTFKFIIPMLLGFFPENLIVAHGLNPEHLIDNSIHFLLLGDILQLAGVSLIIMSFCVPIFKNKYVILAVALSIVLSTRAVSGIRLGIGGVDYVLDLLWGNQYNVYFPVFPWMGFILLGRFVGELYKENKTNIPFFFQKVLLLSATTIVIGASLCYYNYDYHFGDYYHLGPGGMLLLLGVNTSFIYFSHFISKIILNTSLFQFLVYASKNVTIIYFLQWVVIDWGMGLFGFATMNQQGVLMIIPIYSFLVFAILTVFDKVFRNKSSLTESLATQ
ncbi:heparan-alpha-glucosaminide N-acetyltransferase domain-containing protein [Flammeovirga sp. EKP202]|uniref:heparan-alpha-glucosaminide N-acetyltransferase domain-containing protein n=1 Tax=Flammeovirga sp. EKP202 TaxID=2770592 RepID=UPI00165FA752|nr:heparan-alpha-glucosaminide N-acetyltransferase domain-containing protein [Flammeovirga sp. EKP202]